VGIEGRGREVFGDGWDVCGCKGNLHSHGKLEKGLVHNMMTQHIWENIASATRLFTKY